MRDNSTEHLELNLQPEINNLFSREKTNSKSKKLVFGGNKKTIDACVNMLATYIL